MTNENRPQLVLERAIQPDSKKHTVNDDVYVLHCHHYATLYTQLAEDARSIADGPAILHEATADTYRGIFDRYFQNHDVTEVADRVSIVEQLFAAGGLGQIEFSEVREDGGTVEMEHSHLDEGWIKKWGRRSEPVNYITAGIIAGAFGAFYGVPNESFVVEEVESIVSGADHSKFTVRKA